MLFKITHLKVFDSLINLKVHEHEKKKWKQDVEEEIHPEDVDPDVLRIRSQPSRFECDESYVV